MDKKDNEGAAPEYGLVPADEFLIVELDDRLEFGTAVLETDLIAEDNVACNSTGCTQNGYGCKPK